MLLCSQQRGFDMAGVLRFFLYWGLYTHRTFFAPSAELAVPRVDAVLVRRLRCTPRCIDAVPGIGRTRY